MFHLTQKKDKIHDDEEEISELSGRKNPRQHMQRDPYLLRDRNISCNIVESYLTMTNPTNLEEALKSDDSNKWKDAIKEELDSLEENKTWILVPRPENVNVISNKWIFKKWQWHGE